MAPTVKWIKDTIIEGSGARGRRRGLWKVDGGEGKEERWKKERRSWNGEKEPCEMIGVEEKEESGKERSGK